MDGEQGSGGELHGLPDVRHIGRRHQGPGIDAQKQMVHGGVAHHADETDLVLVDARFLCQLRKKLPELRQDGLLKNRCFGPHGGFDPGDDIRAELGLGVNATGGGEQLAGFSAEQESHQCGGADVKCGYIFMEAVGFYRGAHARFQDGNRIRIRKRYDQILPDLGLAGENSFSVDQDLAFAAGAPSAAGGIRVQTRADHGLQDRGARFHGNRDVVGKKGYRNHRIPSLCGIRGRWNASAP